MGNVIGSSSYTPGASQFTQYTKFNELRYFTGVVTLTGLGNLPNLLEITLPEGGSLTELGTGALAYSYLPMEMLVVPEGVTLLNNHCIGRSSCYLKNLSLPSTLRRIANYWIYQMPRIQTVRIYATTPPSAGNSTNFKNVPSTVQFYVPDSAYQSYLDDAAWSQLSSRIHRMSEFSG